MSSWTYSGDPASDRIDQVRFLSGQTSTGDDVLVYDEEIEWALTSEGGIYYAAALVAQMLGTRYAGRVTSKKVGDLAITYGERSAQYLERANDLRRQGAMRGALPFAGGAQVPVSSTGAGQVFSVGMDDIVGDLNSAST